MHRSTKIFILKLFILLALVFLADHSRQIELNLI